MSINEKAILISSIIKRITSTSVNEEIKNFSSILNILGDNQLIFLTYFYFFDYHSQNYHRIVQIEVQLALFLSISNVKCYILYSVNQLLLLISQSLAMTIRNKRYNKSQRYAKQNKKYNSCKTTTIIQCPKDFSLKHMQLFYSDIQHSLLFGGSLLYKNINMSQRKLKQKRIKKGNKKQKNEQHPQGNQHIEPDVDVQTNKPESIQEIPRLVLKYQADPNLNDDISEYKIIKPLLRPLKQVATLQPEVRSKLKEQHNHIAEYIFLTQREKSKYFHQKNLKYNRTMQMPGSLAARKISFKRDFEVRQFSKEQAPSQVKSTKSSRDKYNQKIHYS